MHYTKTELEAILQKSQNTGEALPENIAEKLLEDCLELHAENLLIQKGLESADRGIAELEQEISDLREYYS